MVMRKQEQYYIYLGITCPVVPVGWRGEETQDDISSLHVDDAARGVEEVEVKVRVSGDGAVEPRL